MIKEILVTDLKAKLDNNDDVLLLDVREKDEWDSGYIKGAVFFPMSQVESNLDQILESKDREVILQCRSGRRSMDVAALLLGEGFTNLSNLSGGILAWTNQGYSVEN